MTLKRDSKHEGKLTPGLKNDKKNLVNFHASHRQSENLHFHGLILSKAYIITDEKLVIRVISHDT